MSSKLNKNCKFVWIDLETTGLDIEKDTIIEIGMIVSDINFQAEYFYDAIVDSFDPKAISSYVRKMHARSGLTAEMQDMTSFPGIAAAEQAFLVMLESIQAEAGEDELTFYPAGSSVHFDLDFIRRDMPTFYSRLSHRHLDLTSVKIGIECADPKFKNKVKQQGKPHRAFGDICTDYEFARKYLRSKKARKKAKKSEHNFLRGILEQYGVE